MAKLNTKDRKKVGKAEAVSGEFEPLKPGKYPATLSEVETRVSNAGNPMWNITYTDLQNMDGETAPGRQWYTLMLPQDAMPEDYTPSPGALKRSNGDVEAAWDNYQEFVAGRIKAWFEAHGYTVDTDTDEMIGEKAILQIGVETINRGERAGQRTNRVNAVLALGDHEVDGDEDEDGDF